MTNLPLVTWLFFEGDEVPDEPIHVTIDKHTTGLASVDDQKYILSSLSNEK